MREVEVEILHFVLVDGRAHVLVRLEGRTERYGMGFDQGTVYLIACGASRDEADLEFFTLSMLCFCVGGQCFWHSFWCTY